MLVQNIKKAQLYLKCVVDPPRVGLRSMEAIGTARVHELNGMLQAMHGAPWAPQTHRE